MKKSLYILAPIALLLVGCADNEPAPAVNDGDLVEVHFKIGGYYGAPLSDLDSRATTNGQDTPDYDRDLVDYKPNSLPDGSTVWISIQHQNENEGGDLKSFVVRGNTLYPCTVDDDGTYIDQVNTPLYLERGHAYSIKMMGPARKLTENDKLYIENGQEVYAHDARYPQTAPLENFVITDQEVVDTIELNPVIQQTAKLKFTLVTEGKWEDYTDSEGQYWVSPIHSLEINETGIVITGLQEHYSQHNSERPIHNPEFEGDYSVGTPWNWKWANTYLQPYPGETRNYMTLTTANAIEMTNERLVLETCILPTDATSVPIIVEFYLRVNGVPTQFEMMLNRKIFLSGYQYHYKGKLDITGGITVIEWQTLIQELDPIDVNNPGN